MWDKRKLNRNEEVPTGPQKSQPTFQMEICSPEKEKKKKLSLSQKTVTRSYLPQVESKETDLL